MEDDLEVLVSNLLFEIGEGQLSRATEIACHLQSISPGSDVSTLANAILHMAHGRALDAIHALAGHEEKFPHIKAFCLYVLCDPSWEGIAREHENSENDDIRHAMKTLLGQQVEDQDREEKHAEQYFTSSAGLHV